MELTIKQIKDIIQDDHGRRQRIAEAKRYYTNVNDIKGKGLLREESDPMRNADNRISHNFHQILVDEKAAYMFTYPVLFNVESDTLSEREKNRMKKLIQDTLGDDFDSKTVSLCVEASNCSCGWLHYWADDVSNQFKVATVKAEQVIPYYSNDLEHELIGILRYYPVIEDKKHYTYVEVWDKVQFTEYVFQGGTETGALKYISEKTIGHTFEEVPFIEFLNNNRHQSDLSKYKDLIDLYDKVVSGYANDLEDIQQLIYIIENYDGVDLNQFLGDLRRYKAVKVDSTEQGKGGVSTMQIEIPVEARNKILELVKKQIYESGQGLQQDTESVGNASGVALKFFYRKLELKSGLMQTEFKKGFNRLIRAVLKYHGEKNDFNIVQTFTRNMISNDLENAQIAQSSVGILPEKLILRNHPWVENVEEAEKLLEEERKTIQVDPYATITTPKEKEDGEQ